MKWNHSNGGYYCRIKRSGRTRYLEILEPDLNWICAHPTLFCVYVDGDLAAVSGTLEEAKSDATTALERETELDEVSETAGGFRPAGDAVDLRMFRLRHAGPGRR